MTTLKSQIITRRNIYFYKIYYSSSFPLLTNPTSTYLIIVFLIFVKLWNDILDLFFSFMAFTQAVFPKLRGSGTGKNTLNSLGFFLSCSLTPSWQEKKTKKKQLYQVYLSLKMLFICPSKKTDWIVGIFCMFVMHYYFPGNYLPVWGLLGDQEDSKSQSFVFILSIVA